MVVGVLPDEIITDILIRLPGKSLLRFRCVHRTWYSLLKSSYFITNHFQNSNNKNLGFIIFNYIASLGYTLSSYDISYVRLDLPIPIPSELLTKYRLMVVGSCNGLVCLYASIPSLAKRIFLYNPTLREYKIIYDSTLMDWNVAMGFGCDSVNNDYKVVRIITSFPRNKGSYQAEVYKLGTDSWREVGKCPDFECASFFHMNQCFLNGAIHWLVSSHDSIVSFDVTTEVFKLLKLPDCVLETSKYRRIGVYRQFICVVSSFFTEETYEMWLMEKYGVEDSWTKLHSIRFSVSHTPWILGYPWILGLGMKGELLFPYGNVLWMYYPENQDFKRVKLVDQSIKLLGAVTCIESLVSLKEENDDDKYYGYIQKKERN